MSEFFITILQTVIFFILLQILIGQRFKVKEGLITLILVIGVTPLFEYVGYWANLVILAIFSVALFLKKYSIYFAITISAMVYILSILSDYATNLFLGNIIKFDLATIYSNEVILVLYVFTMFLFECIGAYFIHKAIAKINLELVVRERKQGLIFLFMALLTLAVFYVNIYFSGKAGFTSSTLKLNTIMFMIYAIILIIIFYGVVRSTIQDIEVRNQKELFEELKEYTSTLESLHKEMRVFRHDYINILSSMAGYMEKDDMEGLKEFFSDNIVPINQTMTSNNHKISLLQNIHIMELKGLIAIKLIRAQELKINAMVEVVEEIDEINMPSIDLCKIVGILLDNAVEAASESKDPFIRLAVVKREDSTLIVFANSVPENMPPIYKVFEEGFSTKGDGRGLGLASLRETIQKYPNVTLATKLMDREFIQELEIM
jgi:two-component system sensor histidine kinase AgrC